MVMEDILKFLLVVGVLVLGIARQSAKKTMKDSRPGPDIPTPDTGHPQPEPWEDGNSGTPRPASTETRGEPAPYAFQPSDTRKQPEGKSRTSRRKPETPPHTAHNVPPQTTDLQEAEQASEFSIRSAEEARKALVWSEILQRKY